MFCKNCGIELDENAEFCAQCDKKLAKSQVLKKQWLLQGKNG